MPTPIDVFISHASENTNAVAHPLKEALVKKKLNVWLDQSDLKVGQSVSEEINRGLRDSRIVVAIISRAFLKKEWTLKELDAASDKLFLILYDISAEELRLKAPLFGRLKSISWTEGEAKVVAAILDRLEARGSATSELVVDLAHGQRNWDDLAAAVGGLSPKPAEMVRGFFEEPDLLKAARILILPPPRKYRFSKAEIDIVDAWVAAGGGLLLMGHYHERHHQMNISEVAWRFDLEFVDDVVLPSAHADRAHARSTDANYIVTARPSSDNSPLAAGVREAAFISAASVRSTTLSEPDFTLKSDPSAVVMRPLGRIDADGGRETIDEIVQERTGPVSVLATRRHKKGRVVAVGTWKLFTVEAADNARLIANILNWLRSA